jgi:hypothetical protein
VAASPSSPGHPDVHEHDVRAQAACHLHGVHTGGGVADDLDVVLDAQHQPEARPDRLVVVGDQDADRGPPAVLRDVLGGTLPWDAVACDAVLQLADRAGALHRSGDRHRPPASTGGGRPRDLRVPAPPRLGRRLRDGRPRLTPPLRPH